MNSLLFPLFISYRSCGEKLIKYQANSSWVIVSVVLMTALYNKALILQREIWCWSPLGLKGLKFLFSVVSIFLFICIAIFIHIKNSVRSALLTGPLLIMTHRKRCMPLQWKKKKKKPATGSTGITEYPAGRLTLSLVLYPVPHWGDCKQPLHLPLGFYQLLLLITQTWNFFWWLF